MPASRGPLGYGYRMKTPGSRSITGTRDLLNQESWWNGRHRPLKTGCRKA
jgi:hypothetical protein